MSSYGNRRFLIPPIEESAGLENRRDWYLIPHHNKREKIPFPIQQKSRNQRPFSMILFVGSRH